MDVSVGRRANIHPGTALHASIHMLEIFGIECLVALLLSIGLLAQWLSRKVHRKWAAVQCCSIRNQKNRDLAQCINTSHSIQSTLVLFVVIKHMSTVCLRLKMKSYTCPI